MSKFYYLYTKRFLSVLTAIALAAGFTVATSTSSQATIVADYFVGADTATPGSGGSCETPDYVGATGIQTAINNANSGGTIYLCAGTFAVSTPISVEKDLTITGSGMLDTILDGMGTTQILRVIDTTGTDWEPNSLGYVLNISDMTMRNGSAVADRVDGALDECQSAPRCGGALYIELQASAHISRIFFSHNEAINGGAIGAEGDSVYHAYGSSYTVDKSYFSNNDAQRDGGAISLLYSTGRESPLHFTPTKVTNSTFVNNSAGFSGQHINSNFAIMDVENSSFYSGADNSISDLYGSIRLKYSLAYRYYYNTAICQYNDQLSNATGNFITNGTCGTNTRFADRTGEDSAFEKPVVLMVNPMPDIITTPTPIRFRLESPATGFLTSSCANFGVDAWGTSRVRDNGTCEVGSWQRPPSLLSAADLASAYTPGTISPSGHLNVEYTTGDTILNGGTYVANTAPKLNGQTVPQFSIYAPYTGNNYCDVNLGEGLIYTGANYVNLDTTFDCYITFSIPGNDVHDALDMVQHFTLANNQIETDLSYPVSSISLPDESAPVTPTSRVHLKYGDSSAVASYSSGDNSTCTVDNAGVVTPVEAGSCVIYADVVSGAGGRDLSKTYYLPITNSTPVSCETTSNAPSGLVTSDVMSTATQVCDPEPFMNLGGDIANNPGVEYKGYFYFASTSRRVGNELMRTDGKTTENVVDLVRGSNARGRALDSNPHGLTVFDGKLYFLTDSAPDDQNLTHTVLASTDGETTSSSDLIDSSGNRLSVNSKLVVLGDKMYFSGNDGTTSDWSLYSFDGTNVVQITNPTTDDMKSPTNLNVYKDKLYFQAYHSDWTSSYYRFDPNGTTENALQPLCSFLTECTGINPIGYSSTVWEGDLYLISQPENSNNNGIVKLSRQSDGKDSATNLDLGAITYPESLVSDDSGIYFIAYGPSANDPSVSTGKEVYTYNGSAVSIVDDLIPNDPNSLSNSGIWTDTLAEVGGKVFFSTQSGSNSDDTSLYVKNDTGHFVTAMRINDATLGSSYFDIQGLLNGRFVVAGYSALDYGNAHLYYSGEAIVPGLQTAVAPSINLNGSSAINFERYGTPNGTGFNAVTNLNGVTSLFDASVSGTRMASATQGSWLHGTVLFRTFQWYRCSQPVAAHTSTVPPGCTALGGATQQPTEHSFEAADVDHYLAVRESGSSDTATGYSFSASTPKVDGPPMVLPNGVPSISGNAFVGGTLALNTGTWVGLDGNPLSKVWLSCAAVSAGVYEAGQDAPAGSDCREIPGTTSRDFYTLTSDDVNRSILVKLVGTGTIGTDEAVTSLYTASTALVAQVPTVTTAAKLTGKQKVGETLTAKASTWRFASALTKKWYRCDTAPASSITAIPSGCTALTNTALTYRSVVADAGMYIAYIESITVNGATFYSVSASIRVFAVPTVKTQGAIRGTAKVNQTLTYTDSVWNGPAITKSRQWYACSSTVKAKVTVVPASCKKIASATGSTLRLTAAQKAKFVAVFETVTNPVGTVTSSAAATLAVKP